ncbi:hypothetical protein S40293_04722 [Stachybotrys chartarum IBT 40293]|nr:hypothetical protein S40293_04722 [Stachybotrys chartarum IBT 40293]
MATRSLLTTLVGAVSVAAHGHVDTIVINGVQYAGYDVTSLPYQSNPPVVVGWANGATDNGFVGPEAYGTEDIICHRDSQNAQGRAQVAAGDSIFIQWNTWPESHKGPVLDYLAPCGDQGCAAVDKTTLEFFKIDEVGLVDGSGTPGTYGDDLLIENGNGWMVKIPETIAPGQYVLRHEIIALHSAGQENGAQNYPQCFNLEITGSGTEVPAGTLGTELYKADDEGILFNIYQSLTSYPVPGPAVIAGASAVSQATSAVASTGVPTEGAGSGSAPTTAPAATDAPAATTAPAAVTTATAAPSAVATAGTTTTAAAPVASSAAPSSCSARKHKKRGSRKVRRHARDVKSLNVAPVRV